MKPILTAVAGVLFACALYAPQAHAALIGHWTLDADDIDWGTGAVTDVSGHGNNGTVHNLTASDQKTGQVDGALQFNGTNSYISIPINGSFPVSGNGARTVCMWFKPTDDSWTPDENSIFEYGVAGDSFGIDMDSFPNIQFYTWHNDLMVAMGIAGHQNDWLQICWVWDGTSKSLLYSNGVLRGSQDFGSGINTPQTEVSIGRSALTGGYFPGLIDDVLMYDTALTGGDIETLHDDAVNPAEPSAVASSTGETTATVTWSTATSSDSTVWYGTSPGTYTNSTSSAALVTSHSVGLTGLSSLTTYYFVAVSRDDAGDIATSSEQTLTTVDTTPPALSSVAASGITGSAATIAWTSDEQASTRVAYGVEAPSTYTPVTDASPRVTSHSVSLSSLLACTTYYYAAVSADSAGNAATSSTATFLTGGCAYDDAPVASGAGTVPGGTTATTTVAYGGASFSVAATATSTSFVVQIRAVPNAGILDSYGRPGASPEEVGLTAFDVKAIIDGTTELDSFDVPVTITYQYTDGEVSGLDESTLKLYHYHGGAWVPLDGCAVDQDANSISCTTDSFSIFGLFGSETPSGGSSHGGIAIRWCGPGQTTFCRPRPAAAAGPQCPAYVFGRALERGMTGEDVRALQRLMNCLGFALAQGGPGAPGQETDLFAGLTYDAVVRFQEAYAQDILAPIGAGKGTGVFAAYSQKKAAALAGQQ